MKEIKDIKHLLIVVLLFSIIFVGDMVFIKIFDNNNLMAVFKNESDLLDEIKEKSKIYEATPKNAIIDSVWKKIPAYNGCQVNIEKSYAKMEDENKFDSMLLVCDEKKPEINTRQVGISPIYKGNPNKPMVAFAVNVAWGNEYLPHMLKKFRKNNIKVTFFLEGRWANNNKQLVKELDRNGHELGNHSYTHADFQRISREKTATEIEQTNRVIKDITGKDAILFAPPSGSFNNETVKIASSKGMETILWSVDTIDWRRPHPSKIVNRISSKVHPGAIILMHPTSSTVDALDDMIQVIKRKNLQISSVSDLISPEYIIPVK
ncbi:MAG: putative polysaccharide deacetylaseputative [Bacillales bacterium]|jgi:probable sporulation protein (polysaccharide deacetylase family)|nr:putative polysaccharide deacetylaseputative [Bacillales bacterium]